MGLEDLTKYRSAAVALQHYEKKNETAAKGALEILAGALDMGKDGPILLNMIRKSDRGDKLLANTYAPGYQKTLMNAKIKELFKFYSDYFKEYIEGDSYAEAAKFFTSQYGSEKYEDILSEYMKAQKTLDNPVPNLTDEEKEKAQATLEKYGKIVIPIQAFEQLEIEKLSGPTGRDALKKDLTQMFKPEKKAEGKK